MILWCSKEASWSCWKHKSVIFMWVSSHLCSAESSAVLTNSWGYDEVGERRGSSWLLCFVVCSLLGYLLNIMQCHCLCLSPTQTYRILFNSLESNQKKKKGNKKHHLKSWQQMHLQKLLQCNAVTKSISIFGDFNSTCGKQRLFTHRISLSVLVFHALKS